MNAEQPIEYLIRAMRNGRRAIFLIVCLLTITACGGDKPAELQDNTDTEHFLSDQQKALDRSKAAAAAMAEAAAARAQQTEDARNN